MSPLCCRRSPVCLLDKVLHCKVRAICDAHDANITNHPSPWLVNLRTALRR